MQRDARAYLWDVREAAQAIGRFVGDLGPSDYAESPMVHAAVERKFEIIGEALGQLAKLDHTLAARIPHLAQVVAFRNQLIHGYALVNHTTVWNVVHRDLPHLLDAVRDLLAEIESS